MEGVLEQLFALYRADVLREIGEHVVVRAGADVAEQGRNQQQDCDKEYETGFFGNAFCQFMYHDDSFCLSGASKRSGKTRYPRTFFRCAP